MSSRRRLRLQGRPSQGRGQSLRSVDRAETPGNLPRANVRARTPARAGVRARTPRPGVLPSHGSPRPGCLPRSRRRNRRRRGPPTVAETSCCLDGSAHPGRLAARALGVANRFTLYRLMKNTVSAASRRNSESFFSGASSVRRRWDPLPHPKPGICAHRSAGRTRRVGPVRSRPPGADSAHLRAPARLQPRVSPGDPEIRAVDTERTGQRPCAAHAAPVFGQKAPTFVRPSAR